MIVLTRTRRIDWPRVVQNLQRVGMSMQGIADALDVSKAQVINYGDAEGTMEPAFWVGAALLVLWSKRTGLPWADAPTRDVAESVSRVLRATA